MKSRFIILIVMLNMAWFRPTMAQGTIKSDSLDSVLLGLKDPKEKVDAILNFLDDPENQYLDNAIDYAERAYQITLQTNYVSGKIRSMIMLGNNHFRRSEYKKAMEYAKEAQEMAEDLHMVDELADALSLMGIIYTELGDNDKSSKYFFKSLELFENLEDKEGISRSMGNIGLDFYSQKDYKKALEYYNNSLIIAQSINNQNAIKKQFNNIAVVYGDLQKFDTAIIFLRKALAISIKQGDKLGQGTNIMNIGFIQMNKGEYNDALLNLQQAYNLASEMNNRSLMSLCDLNFGFCYFAANRIDESIRLFKTALQEGQNHGYYTIINASAKMLNQIYAEKNDTLNAYKYSLPEKLARDSLFSLQKQKLISKLELQYVYEKKEFERKLAQQNKNIVMLIIIFSLISGLIILGLVFSRHRLKSKFIVLEKEKIESELDIKNRELTVNLISLIKKNEMLTDISNKLVQLESNAKGLEAKEIITLISRELRNSTDDKMHNEFSQRFQEVHAGFYEKLLQTYPDLTQNELKLCAFLRLNMSTKDISELTNQQLPSIDQARYRLRKKLGISNSETNLVTFLSQI